MRIAFPTVPEPPAPVAARSDLAWLGRGTILLVDDEESVRKALARALKKFGLAVVLVAGGEEALDVLREQPCRIDVVITDLTMPGMNGVALARAIRALHVDLPIILITGYGEIPDESAQVFTSALAKPFDLAALRSTLQQLLPAATP